MARGEGRRGWSHRYIYTHTRTLYIHTFEDGGISDRERGKLARDFVVEGRGREKAVEKGWVVRDAREMSERESEQLTNDIYIHTHLDRYIHISVWRKGEYIGTKGWTGKGRERKWQEGIEERDGKRVRCAEAESNRGSPGAVNVDDDDDDHHQHRHSYRHWLGHTSVCRFPS